MYIFSVAAVNGVGAYIRSTPSLRILLTRLLEQQKLNPRHFLSFYFQLPTLSTVYIQFLRFSYTVCYQA